MYTVVIYITVEPVWWSQIEAATCHTAGPSCANPVQKVFSPFPPNDAFMMSHPAMSLGDRFHCDSRKGGTGGGGACTRRVQTAWPCLGSAVERSWSALGGGINGLRK